MPKTHGLLHLATNRPASLPVARRDLPGFRSANHGKDKWPIHPSRHSRVGGNPRGPDQARSSGDYRQTVDPGSPLRSARDDRPCCGAAPTPLIFW